MIAKGGRMFIAVSAVGSVVALQFSIWASAALMTLTILLCFFFRDPDRDPGEGIVAPADGVVREVDLDRGLISTYLALRNVHVTRMPIKGRVLSTIRSGSSHFPAFSRSVKDNEKVEVVVDTQIGAVKIVHMSGALARRIVSYVAPGDDRDKGDRIGLIRFGSRVDLFLPADTVGIVAQRGQRVKAGVSKVAEVLDERSR